MRSRNNCIVQTRDLVKTKTHRFLLAMETSGVVLGGIVEV